MKKARTEGFSGFLIKCRGGRAAFIIEVMGEVFFNRLMVGATGDSFNNTGYDFFNGPFSSGPGRDIYSIWCGLGVGFFDM